MAARVEDVRALAAIHAREVCAGPDEWMSYLNAAAKFYRYPFADSFLIHAQKPTAQAVASFDDWKSHMGRWVKKGSVGIALFDDRGSKLRLRYVFDIRDTGRGENFKRIYLWRMERKHEPAIRDHLRDTYGLTIKDGTSIPVMLKSLAKRLTSENIRQAMYDLNKNRDNSYLASMDEVALLKYFTDLVEQSLAYVLMQRCGYHPTEHMEDNWFSAIALFDDINVLPYLGEAVHTIAEPVLLDIGRQVREMDIIEHKRELEKAPTPGQVQFNLDGSNVTFEIKDFREEEVYVRSDDKGCDADRYHAEKDGDVGYLSDTEVSSGGRLLPAKSFGREPAAGEYEGEGSVGENKVSSGKESGSIPKVYPDGCRTAGDVKAATAIIEQQAADRKEKSDDKQKKPIEKKSVRDNKQPEKKRLKDRLAEKKKEAEVINAGLQEVKERAKEGIR